MSTSEYMKNVVDLFYSYDELYSQLIDYGAKSFQLILDIDNVWKRLELKWMLEHFIAKEEYEKCSKIKSQLDVFFIADDNRQVELHRKLKYRTHE
jgi:hypothetical protein